jgi:hypothetical protein
MIRTFQSIENPDEKYHAFCWNPKDYQKLADAMHRFGELGNLKNFWRHSRFYQSPDGLMKTWTLYLRTQNGRILQLSPGDWLILPENAAGDFGVIRGEDIYKKFAEVPAIK